MSKKNVKSTRGRPKKAPTAPNILTEEEKQTTIVKRREYRRKWYRDNIEHCRE